MLKEENAVKTLSEGKGRELQHNKSLKRKELNSFLLLTRISRLEAGGKSKNGGETEKHSARFKCSTENTG